MKLKKIASLMLAGIMAVSMLAGCKNGTTPDDDSSSSQVPVVSGVVGYANDALSVAQKEVFTFKASADLDKILNDVANDTDNLNSGNIKTIYDNYSMTRWTTGASEAKVKKGIEGKLTDAYIATNFNTAPTSNVKSQKAVEVYTVSGALAEKDAIVRVINDYKTYITSAGFPLTVGSKYSCDYEAEISAVKVESPENSAKTAWVVAMVFTQNLTANDGAKN